VSLLNLKLKSLIVVGIVLCLGALGYFNYFKKSKPEGVIKNETVVSAPTLISPAATTKPATVYKENLDQQTQLKTLEFKLSEARTKHQKLSRLRTVIEGHIKLRQDLLKLAQDRVTHIQALQKEDALNDQDVELARGQLVTLEASIEKSLRDKQKVSQLISGQELEVSKAEAELKKFKSL